MKHDTFGEYLADLQEIHAKMAPERMALKQKWDAAQKRWQEDQREFKGDEHYLAREKVRYLDAQDVGRRIEGDINGKLFFQPFSH